MTHILKTIPNTSNFIHTQLNYSPYHQKKQTKKLPRQQTTLNSKDYKRSLRRAFSRAKLLSFFNPDLTHFITFTYQTNNHTPSQTLSDIKNLIKLQKYYYTTKQPPQTPTTPQTQQQIESESRMSEKEKTNRQTALS